MAPSYRLLALSAALLLWGAQASYTEHPDTDCDLTGTCLNNCIWTEGVTPAQCMTECDGLAGCTGFVWRPEQGGKCKFDTGVAAGPPEQGRSCYVKDATGDSCYNAPYTEHADTDCDLPGTCLNNCIWTEGVTPEQCMTECNSLDGCMGFVWRPQQGGKCKFNTGVAAGQPEQGRSCYVKGTCCGDGGHNSPYTEHADTDCDSTGTCLNNCWWTEGVTPAQCMTECDGLAGCTGFVWRPEQGGKCKFGQGVFAGPPEQGRSCYVKGATGDSCYNAPYTDHADTDCDLPGTCLNNCIWTEGVTPEQCKTECNSLEDCMGFVWIPEQGGMCKFNTGVAAGQPEQGRSCHVKGTCCGDGGHNSPYTEHPDTDCDLTGTCLNNCIWTEGVTPAECMTECDGLAGCMGFVWRPEQGGKCKFDTGVAAGPPEQGRSCFVKGPHHRRYTKHADPAAGPGLCCYGGCGGNNCQGGWCGETQARCEGSCNGEFCPAAAGNASHASLKIAKEHV